MEYVNILIHNKILVAGLIGWGTAQILKLIIHLAVNKKLDLERLIGDGGMPSGHSATVAAVATSTAFQCGLDSPEFAIATIVAIKNETGSWRWALFAASYTTVVAWITSALVFQIGSLLL